MAISVKYLDRGRKMDKSKKTKNRQIAELEHRLLDAVTADEVHQDDIVEEKETTVEKNEHREVSNEPHFKVVCSISLPRHYNPFTSKGKLQ